MNIATGTWKQFPKEKPTHYGRYLVWVKDCHCGHGHELATMFEIGYFTPTISADESIDVVIDAHPTNIKPYYESNGGEWTVDFGGDLSPLHHGDKPLLWAEVNDPETV